MKYIIGLDEAALGTCFGEMFVVAVKSPINWAMDGLNDSKKLSKDERKLLSNQLRNCNDIGYLALSASNDEIDKHSLGVMHKTLMASLIDNFWEADAEIIIDGNINPKLYKVYSKRQDNWDNVRSEIKADGKYAQVMAASIIAKSSKDCEMEEKHILYPEYGFNNHSGYLTANHIRAIKKYGLTPFHRKSYNIKLV